MSNILFFKGRDIGVNIRELLLFIYGMAGITFDIKVNEWGSCI